MWDTLNLLPKEDLPQAYQERINTTPQCESFMHLHLGFDAEVSFAVILAKCFAIVVCENHDRFDSLFPWNFIILIVFLGIHISI